MSLDSPRLSSGVPEDEGDMGIDDQIDDRNEDMVAVGGTTEKRMRNQNLTKIKMIMRNSVRLRKSVIVVRRSVLSASERPMFRRCCSMRRRLRKPQKLPHSVKGKHVRPLV